MSDFLQALMEKRRKFLDGLDANEGDINLDIFEDFYPDQAHFVYELLQNAEDAGASEASFTLANDGCWFEHDGARPFTESDVQAITGIHNSSKTKESEQIGKFGVGFKSVFVYTLTPEIYSTDFSFRISRLVMPEPIAGDPTLGNRTKFWLPFNNLKKTPQDAFSEIRSGLNELSEETLLFLSGIESIKWQVKDELSGEVLRIKHANSHIEVMKQISGQTTISSHFLKFDQLVADLEKQRIAIAFALEFLPNVKAFTSNIPIVKQMKIAPVPQGQVAVFFPAEKETSGLRFNLHAPFIPELSRASIKDTPANEPLFGQLADLCAASLHDIKELGLLKRDFLAVLPNGQDTLGRRYVQIREAIVEAFNEEPLMPTFGKGHAPAKHLYQAKVSLKELLSAEDIEFLIEHDDVPPQWSANRELQGTNTERFMSGLAIQDWDVADFLEVVAEKAKEKWGGPDEDFIAWLSQKPVEWVQRMYAMLAREPETEDELYQLSDARIIRLTDGTFSTGNKCYFPDEKLRYVDIVPCVDGEILETGSSKPRKKASRKFLEELGVQEIGERQLIQALLEKEYKTADRTLKETAYLEHLRRFLKLVNDEPSATNMFTKYNLFLGADGKWHPANHIYLDRPYADTGISDYYEIVNRPKDFAELAGFYKDLSIDTPKLVRFIEALGAHQHIPINKVRCQQNPEWEHLRRAPGERYTSPSDEDYRIENFENLVAARNVRISRLIWNTMHVHGKDSTWRGVLQAQYRKNWSGGSHYARSQLVHQLRKFEWVPQGEQFVRPAAARAELLPDGFTFDPGWAWIKAIEFGKAVDLENEKARAAEVEAIEKQTRRQEAAVELGFQSDDLTWLERLKEVPADQRERMFEEWERSRENIELPENEPRNLERRAERVGAIASEAPERLTEKRTRSVSVGREDVKAEAAQYLQQQYASDGDVICQVCKKPMPFKLDDGSAYFEKVEFLSELKKRHHQNYLALCPNHAAMFKHANGTKDIMMEMVVDIRGNELEVVLAQRDEIIYFTKTHVADIKTVIEVDSSLDCEISIDDDEVT
ncbi:sacsin N-terminal ATP-binding-like domain-containing protein [Thalassospira alkalitolerans]|uniref:sacsin N-terminal ATP-binding-like domain-containing protein n=1 Tax=Thalassospira alkalitolerans TaxID=1293890 RepID=UPI0030EECC1B